MSKKKPNETGAVEVISFQQNNPQDLDMAFIEVRDAGGTICAGNVRASTLRQEINTLSGTVYQGDDPEAAAGTERLKRHVRFLQVQLDAFPVQDERTEPAAVPRKPIVPEEEKAQ